MSINTRIHNNDTVHLQQVYIHALLLHEKEEKSRMQKSLSSAHWKIFQRNTDNNVHLISLINSFIAFISRILLVINHSFFFLLFHFLDCLQGWIFFSASANGSCKNGSLFSLIHSKQIQSSWYSLLFFFSLFFTAFTLANSQDYFFKTYADISLTKSTSSNHTHIYIYIYNFHLTNG